MSLPLPQEKIHEVRHEKLGAPQSTRLSRVRRHVHTSGESRDVVRTLNGVGTMYWCSGANMDQRYGGPGIYAICQRS